MNFEQLREIVRNIKAQVSCPSCAYNFQNKDIFVVTSLQEKSVLFLQCEECNSPIVVSATMQEDGVEISHKKQEILDSILSTLSTDEKVQQSENIVIDDVINVHEFLRDFSGDFKGFFRR